MSYSHVLGEANGPLDATLLVVGEAPGRDGAARTGVPFHGDRSGDRFEALLAAAELRREELFVTNAVLCNPLDERGANRRPLASEVAACVDHLGGTLELVLAPVVAALGAVALDSLARVAPHGVGSLVAEAGRARSWAGRTLVPLVHPSPRTQGARTWKQQLEDWRAVGELVREKQLATVRR
jgi:uracil-DNA glycosylase family 4